MTDRIPITKTPSMFPDPREADEDGILCLSADLNVPMLIDAYRHGIFPWPFDNRFIPWCSPDPRGVLKLNEVHISRSVKRVLKKNEFYFKVDTSFEEVIRACAEVKRIEDDGSVAETWITRKIIKAYCSFHKAGYAHSFEAYSIATDKLVGGLYGVSVGQVFCGESMFHTVSGASKFALYHALDFLRAHGVAVLDTQMVTPATEMFGAKMISKAEYLELLALYGGPPLKF